MHPPLGTPALSLTSDLSTCPASCCAHVFRCSRSLLPSGEGSPHHLTGKLLTNQAAEDTVQIQTVLLLRGGFVHPRVTMGGGQDPQVHLSASNTLGRSGPLTFTAKPASPGASPHAVTYSRLPDRQVQGGTSAGDAVRRLLRKQEDDTTHKPGSKAQRLTHQRRQAPSAAHTGSLTLRGALCCHISKSHDHRWRNPGLQSGRSDPFS